MHVSLTPALEKAVKEQANSSPYHNASKVIREGLRLPSKTEAEYDWLKREATIGFVQLESGKTVTIRTKRSFSR
jgi:putative addiction module CopG family antidote